MRNFFAEARAGFSARKITTRKGETKHEQTDGKKEIDEVDFGGVDVRGRGTL